jgi:hypothetical protein
MEVAVMGWNEDGLGLWRICPICGKKFLPEVLHVYYDKTDPNQKRVCTYSCMRESERRLEERHKQDGRRLRARRLDPETMTAEQMKRREFRKRPFCGGCSYAGYDCLGDETRITCSHPDSPVKRGLLAVMTGRDNGKKIKTPKWCPRRQEEET